MACSTAPAGPGGRWPAPCCAGWSRCSFRMARWWLGSTRRSSGAGGRRSRRAASTVRSSHGHFVKASGLRWISVMLLVHIPWAGRIWGLPFLTALAPSERFARQVGRRHKPLADWGRQLLLLASRWLPGRRLIAVADTTYAVTELLAAVRHRLTMVTRLRLDARLFDPPPPHRPGTRGRRRVTGQRQPTLVQRLADPASRWRRVVVSQWYGDSRRELDILTGTAVWDHPGRRVP